MAIQIGIDDKLALLLHKTLLRMLPIIRGHHNRKTNGGYFTVCSVGDNTFPHLIIGCGDVADMEKAKATFEFSGEKAQRLAEHPDHLSSAQSRNFDKKKFAGAIRISQQNLILSFSGLPETCDEALMLHVAVACHLLHRDQALHIASLWDNDIYAKL